MKFVYEVCLTLLKVTRSINKDKKEDSFPLIYVEE